MTRSVFQMFAIAFILAVLQSDEIHGCQWNSECDVQGQICCHVGQPSCMDSYSCLLMKYYAAKSTESSTIPKFTVPDLNFGWPRHAPENVEQRTSTETPEYIHYTIPDIPNSHNDGGYNDGGYNGGGYDDGDSTTSRSPTGATVGVTIALTIVLLFIYVTIKCVRIRRRYQLGTTTRRPPCNTNPANQVSRQRGQPSRIIIVAVCRDGEDNRNQIRPPDGEPPFLSEEDLRNDVSTNPSHELPTYEEATTAEPCPPSYESMASTFESDLQPLVDGGAEQDSGTNPTQVMPDVQYNPGIPSMNSPSFVDGGAEQDSGTNPTQVVPDVQYNPGIPSMNSPSFVDGGAEQDSGTNPTQVVPDVQYNPGIPSMNPPSYEDAQGKYNEGFQPPLPNDTGTTPAPPPPLDDI